MPNPETAEPARTRKPVRLALQGGGAHGAFTWGVLDRMLEEPDLSIEAVSGTSAGAMNAVVLADGLKRGGPEGAREALADFWNDVGKAAVLSPFRQGVMDRMSGRASLDNSPGFLLMEGLARFLSPYDLNPLSLNPLREIVARHVDFERINAASDIAVHVTATEVSTGLPRVFSQGSLSVDAVMASACLPQLFPAVEIEGEAYWDGGFTGNPSLFPLIDGVTEADLILVQINPVERDGVPRGARDIINRMNEITFNASLVKELAALYNVAHLWPDIPTEDGPRPAIRLHHIHSGEAAEVQSASSKLDAGARQLSRLFDMGRARAGTWFADHPHSIGQVSTLELDALFGPRPQIPDRETRAESFGPRPDTEERPVPILPYLWGVPIFWAFRPSGRPRSASS
ncbi:patatin-like phospholipase family protein [Amaricoccus macauensis]|uniref:patatin-like phospholipase family protein n=1 Tax=Amaricoccus macauensis TaxID=57001 RepID=UPI003C7C8C54